MSSKACNWFEDWKQEGHVELKLTFMHICEEARNIAILLLYEIELIIIFNVTQQETTTARV